MFYDKFVALCDEKNVKPQRACIDMGMSRSLAAKWKATKTEKPSADALEKMAIYFGKSVDEILGIAPPTPKDCDDLDEYLEVLRNRSECRMLFSLAKGATKADVEKAVAIIEALRKAEGR